MLLKLLLLFLRRHRWDLILFWLISLLAAVVFSSEASGEMVEVVRHLEAMSLVLLLGRITLSNSAFSTVAGWQAKPLSRWNIIGAQVFTLLVAMMPFLALKFCLAREFVDFRSESMMQAWNSFAVMVLIWIAVFLFLMPWWSNLSQRSRRNRAWGCIIAFLFIAPWAVMLISGGNSYGVGQRRGGGGTSDGVLSPLKLLNGNHAMWLADYPSHKYQIEASTPSITRIPIVLGDVKIHRKVRVQVNDLQLINDRVHLRFGVHWLAGEKNWASDGLDSDVDPALMLKFKDGYYAQARNVGYLNTHRWLSLLPVVGVSYEADFRSPIALPENRSTAQELLEGLELWIAYQGEKVASKYEPVDSMTEFEAEISHECLRLNWELAEKKSKEPVKSWIWERHGKSAVPIVLKQGPWTPGAWHAWTERYLHQNLDHSHLGDVLQALERDPLIGEVCVIKGWFEDAQPILEKHLRNGRLLGEKTLIEFAKLQKKEHGPFLEKQLYLLEDGFDRMAWRFSKHPGIDWDQFKEEAWKRAEYGYLDSRLAESWAAHQGNKEALRRLVARGLVAQGEELEQVRNRLGYVARFYEFSEMQQKWDQLVYTEKGWRIQ